MKTVMCAFVMMALAGLPTQAALELQLTTRLSEQLPYLRPNMRLEVVNASPDSVLFPKNAFDIFLFLETEEGWRKCRPSLESHRPPLSTIDWHEVSRERPFSVTIPSSRCAEGEGTWLEWANQPGIHRVKAQIATYAQKIGVPAGAFDGVLESNVLEFRIKEPAGVDSEAIAWAKGSPMKVELLAEFPTSEYAAFFIYGYSARIDQVDPERMRSLIDRGVFPSQASLPTQEGWRSLTREDVAKWQIEWGQRIVREHPDFPFLDEVKLSVALARMGLGDHDEALKAMAEIAEKGSTEAANWARVFLASEPTE